MQSARKLSPLMKLCEHGAGERQTKTETHSKHSLFIPIKTERFFRYSRAKFRAPKCEEFRYRCLVCISPPNSAASFSTTILRLSFAARRRYAGADLNRFSFSLHFHLFDSFCFPPDTAVSAIKEGQAFARVSFALPSQSPDTISLRFVCDSSGSGHSTRKLSLRRCF